MSDWLHPRKGVKKLRDAATVFGTVAVFFSAAIWLAMTYPFEFSWSMAGLVILGLLWNRRRLIQAERDSRRRLLTLESEFSSQLAIKTAEIVSGVVAERDRAIADLQAEKLSSAERVAKAEAKSSQLTREFDEATKLIRMSDLTGQLLVLAGQWDVARKFKPTARKALPKVGTVELNADFYVGRFTETLKKRWPDHVWTPDQVMALLIEFTDRSDVTRWRRFQSAEKPTSV